MHELKQHEQEFLNELLLHPGWPVFLRVIESNKDSLLHTLYACEDDKIYHTTQRWRALHTLYLECKSLENSNNVVQLGLD